MAKSFVLMKAVKAAIVAFHVYVPAHTDSAHFFKASEVMCLAKNIYHEARGEGTTGMALVAQTTRNRVYSGLYENSYCGVVYSPHQFSWTEYSEPPVRDQKAWKKAVEIAALTITDLLSYPNLHATHYYNFRLARPAWRHDFAEVTRYKNHVFLADASGW